MKSPSFTDFKAFSFFTLYCYLHYPQLKSFDKCIIWCQLYSNKFTLELKLKLIAWSSVSCLGLYLLGTGETVRVFSLCRWMWAWRGWFKPHPFNNNNSVISYSPSCHSKPVSHVIKKQKNNNKKLYTVARGRKVLNKKTKKNKIYILHMYVYIKSNKYIVQFTNFSKFLKLAYLQSLIMSI